MYDIDVCVLELKGAVGQIVQGDRQTVFAVEQNKALVPPNYSRYLAWGFPDMSVRIGYYDSDKVLTGFSFSFCLSHQLFLPLQVCGHVIRWAKQNMCSGFYYSSLFDFRTNYMFLYRDDTRSRIWNQKLAQVSCIRSDARSCLFLVREACKTNMAE